MPPRRCLPPLRRTAEPAPLGRCALARAYACLAPLPRPGRPRAGPAGADPQRRVSVAQAS
jgi:hypothetical protein